MLTAQPGGHHDDGHLEGVGQGHGGGEADPTRLHANRQVVVGPLKDGVVVLQGRVLLDQHLMKRGQ